MVTSYCFSVLEAVIFNCSFVFYQKIKKFTISELYPHPYQGGLYECARQYCSGEV